MRYDTQPTEASRAVASRVPETTLVPAAAFLLLGGPPALVAAAPSPLVEDAVGTEIAVPGSLAGKNTLAAAAPAANAARRLSLRDPSVHVVHRRSGPTFPGDSGDDPVKKDPEEEIQRLRFRWESSGTAPLGENSFIFAIKINDYVFKNSFFNDKFAWLADLELLRTRPNIAILRHSGWGGHRINRYLLKKRFHFVLCRKLI